MLHLHKALCTSFYVQTVGILGVLSNFICLNKETRSEDSLTILPFNIFNQIFCFFTFRRITFKYTWDTRSNWTWKVRSIHRKLIFYTFRKQTIHFNQIKGHICSKNTLSFITSNCGLHFKGFAVASGAVLTYPVVKSKVRKKQDTDTSAYDHNWTQPLWL